MEISSQLKKKKRHLGNQVTCKLSITGSFSFCCFFGGGGAGGGRCLNDRSGRNNFNICSAFNSLFHTSVFIVSLPSQNTCLRYFHIHHPPILQIRRRQERLSDLPKITQFITMTQDFDSSLLNPKLRLFPGFVS